MDLSHPAVTAAIVATTSFITAVVTMIAGRSKDRADIHATIASGAGFAVDTITDVLEQVRQELEEARLALNEARMQIEELRRDNASLRQSVALLNVRINKINKDSHSGE
jgi:chromosome segregation ATPase